MAKVLTFSRTFHKGHPRSGQPTHFVEQVLNELGMDYSSDLFCETVFRLNEGKEYLLEPFFLSLDYGIESKKLHTIRSGNRWKKGYLFSPRVWSGKPYNSPQIIFAPDTKVVNTYDFEMWKDEDYFSYPPNFPFLEKLAKNDGLSADDFKAWFKMPSDFDGQIIAWKDPKY